MSPERYNSSLKRFCCAQFIKRLSTFSEAHRSMKRLYLPSFSVLDLENPSCVNVRQLVLCTYKISVNSYIILSVPSLHFQNSIRSAVVNVYSSGSVTFQCLERS